MTKPYDPFAVPEWLADAWQAAINNSRMVPTDFLMAQMSDALDGRPLPGSSWTRWNQASMLAVIGWRQVVAYRASLEDDRGGE